MQHALSRLYHDCQRYLEACGWHQNEYSDYDEDNADFAVWHKGDRTLQMFELVPEGRIQIQFGDSAYCVEAPIELRAVVELAQ